MGTTATLSVRARFVDQVQADRVARYLPEGGRAPLIDDVTAADQDAYRAIEQLDYAFVEREGDAITLCRFEFSLVEDFDEEAPRVLATFRRLGAVDLMGVVAADEGNRLYVAMDDGGIALLILDRERAKSLDSLPVRAIFATIDKVLGLRVKRWPGDLWDAPDDPSEPLLVLLPEVGDDQEDDD